MKNKVVFFLLPILLSGNLLFAQQKFEKEYRLKTSAVPEQARKFVDSLPFDRRVKWYVEISELGKTVEAKSKFEHKRYSVEFDSTGKFLDLEIEVDFSELPKDVKEIITQNLESKFGIHHITKTQTQLIGPQEIIQTYLIGNKSEEPEQLSIKYEILVKGSKNKEVSKCEIIFSNTGNIEKESEILFRNTDNLEY